MTTHSPADSIKTTSFVRPSIWSAGAIGIAVPISIPIIAILLTFLTPTSEVWEHLRESVLLEYIVNTIILLILVGGLSAAMGVVTAWLVATRNFPGRGWIMWALMLPIAAPAYVVAYAYADLLSFAGPVQSMLREAGWLAGAMPSIRSLPGASFVLAITLYPYIYLFSYNAFSQQAKPLTEAARMLGARSTKAFFRVALPHARPAIAGGVALALMEAAADFGVVDFFGVPTLTNGIFRTWYAQGEHQAAMQLAGWLFVVVAILVLLEQSARRGSHANPVTRNIAAQRIEQSRGKGLICLGVCLIPIMLGIVLPTVVFIYHALTTGDPLMGARFFGYITNTLSVAAIAAVLAVLCALWLNYAVRQQSQRSRILTISVRVSTLGYAVPGMVLAIGLIGPLTDLDKWLAENVNPVLGLPGGLLLTGSTATLIFVYLARFLTVAYNSCEGGMTRIHTQYDAAAKSLGASPGRMLRQIHLPIMTPTVLTALLLVFVDVVKELPATLILRPFNFETLATRTYRLASDERIAEASTAALIIVLVGLIPAILIAWQNFGNKSQVNQNSF
ncbi:MAG: iron ABC transporter permease [Pseudomonadota bacterium]